MPKETIHLSTPTDETAFQAVVGWAPDRDVQIGVATNDGRSLLCVLYGAPGSLASLGADIRAIVEHAAAAAPLTDEGLGQLVLDRLDAMTGVGAGNGWTPHGARYNSTWADLDRSQCNRLIRVLRKARDAAYGRDE